VKNLENYSFDQQPAFARAV